MPNDRPQRSTTIRLLERLGCRPTSTDRTGGAHPFSVGGWYAECPKCHQFAAILVDSDGVGWRSTCACWPLGRLDDLDLLLYARHAA